MFSFKPGPEKLHVAKMFSVTLSDPVHSASALAPSVKRADCPKGKQSY